MDDSFAANQAVVKELGPAVVNQRQWFGDVYSSGNPFGIGFEYDNTAGGGATMKAIAALCRNKSNTDGQDNRALDGNAVAPNNDDFRWRILDRRR